MATDNIKRFDDFLDRMQEILDETRKLYEMEEEKPFDYENATIVQKDFAPIKPKFKEGDWIVFNEHTFYIKEVAFGFYKTISFEGVPYNYDWCIDRMARLWTIEDAKEGDVLTDYSDEYENPLIFILKKFEHVDFGLVRPSDYSSYCFLTMGDRPRFKEGHFHHMNNIKPATEEQRETLMKAMHEAGYIFDFEKKELKKVEPEFHEGDWIVLNGSGTYKIVEVCESCYKVFSHDYGMHCFISFDKENDCHLWTIKDAKDGDVLATEESVFIFKYTHNEVCKSYCEVIGNSELGLGFEFSINGIYPATKEQREELVKAIHKAGYEWIEEMKELRKVKPEFHVGDWITNGNLLVGQVTSFDGEYYHYMQDGIEQPLHVSNVHNWHLWTIEDARDGDILAEDSCLFIIRKLNRDLSAEIYCCLFEDGDFSLSSNLVFDETSTYPATKEQREELEKAMHKAGYEWIEEKKEIKKIEPKFHEGDWIVTPENNVLQIASIEGASYTFNDEVHYWGIYYCNEQCHLWTIQDAKDGDVLSCENDIVIFKENNYNPKDKSGSMFAYCSCNYFREFGGINPTDYKPATKEQREELEKAMHDAGYTFDFEDKILKKIEPKFHVGDWITDGQVTCKVLSVTSKSYKLHLYNDDYCHFERDVDSVNKHYHLWTIQDAKEGDILASDDNSEILIFRRIDSSTSFSSYYNIAGRGEHGWSNDSFIPAAKEQRYRLEKAMADSGYVFDFEKKELKKIEPKFHVGDWVITSYDEVNQVVSVDKDGDGYTLDDDVYFSGSWCDMYRLWTIQDAKDGDVLSINWDEGDDSWENIIIFKKYHDKGVKGLINTSCVEGYGNTFKNGKVLDEEIPYYSKTWESNVHPATKEQRETLMKAMAEAGYVFDFKKKELKKIEEKPAIEMKTPEESLDIDSETYNKVVDECIYGKQEPEPKWTEKDKENISMLIDLVESKEESMEVKIELSTWLKALKERTQPQPKQEWSEDDEEMCYKATTVINRLCAEGKDYVWSNSTLNKLFCWLKSLKEKVQPKPNQEWKPTDEQIRELGIVATGKGWFNTEVLGELLEQLKKLKKN